MPEGAGIDRSTKPGSRSILPLWPVFDRAAIFPLVFDQSGRPVSADCADLLCTAVFFMAPNHRNMEVLLGKDAERLSG